MVRGALTALLNLEEDMEVVGEAPNGAEALALARRLQPDIVLTDVEMPEMGGLELAAQLQRSNLTAKIIVLTIYARPGYLQRALASGVSGYLLKDEPSASLAQNIRAIHSGRRVIAPELAMASWGPTNPLTDRERQALQLAEEGKTSKSIASALGISHGTARNYLHEAIQKLGVSNKVEATRLAREMGWL